MLQPCGCNACNSSGIAGVPGDFMEHAGNSLQRQRNSTREAGCNQCHEAGNRDRPGTAIEPDT